MAFVRGGVNYQTFLDGLGRFGKEQNIKGREYKIADRINILAADGDGAIYPIARIPNYAVFLVGSAYLRTTALTTGTDYDFQFFYVKEGEEASLGESVGDTTTELLGGTLDFSTGAQLTGISFMSTWGQTKLGLPLWEAIGLGSQPDGDFILAMVANTASTVDGSVAIELGYTA